MTDQPFDSGDFRRVLGHFPTGVTVVTGVDDDGPAGMAVGSFASVSLDPPLVMFCPGKDSSTWTRIKAGDCFAVNVLGANQADVCGTFAGKSEDRFAGIGWHTEVTGAPVIDEALAWLDCDVHAIHDGGDHDIVVGLVRNLEVTDEHRGPLLFFKGGYGEFQEL